MPIYEYQCQHCHSSFELIQKVTDVPVTICEACGKNTAVRLVSAPGFQLKGTGWYVTDFKDNKSKPTATTQPSSSDNKAAQSAASNTTATSGEKN